MKKAKVIRKKVLWFHSRLEEELGITFEVERIKPRLYQFTHRSLGICLGYTQLQIGLFLGEDIPFAESNGFFLGKEVDLVKNIIRCDYELEFPHRDIVRVEKTIRKWRKELEHRLQEIKRKVIVGGVQNVFGKRKVERKDSKEDKGVGKLHRRRGDQSPGAGAAPKRKGSKDHHGSKVRESGRSRNKQRSGKSNPSITRPVKSKRRKGNGQKKAR